MNDLSDLKRLAPEPAALADLALAVARCEAGLCALTESIEQQQFLMARLREKFIRALWPRLATTEKETQL